MTRLVTVAFWISASAVLAETGPVPVGIVEPYSGGLIDYAALPEPRGEAVHVADAAFLRLHFRTFHLAPGDVLVASTPDGRDLARYRDRGPGGRGEFWSFAITGDTAILHIESGGAATLGQGYGYEVDAVVRGRAGLGGDGGGFTVKSVCGDDGTEDVACHLEEVALAQRPVARLNYVSGGASFVCTGWLVAGASDNTLMTNNHCIATQADADTLEARFNYQASSCGGGDLNADVRYAGATLLRTSAGLDYSLLTLHGDAESAWGELTPSAAAVAAGRPIWLLHHPVGQPKKVGYWEDAEKTQRCDVEAVETTVGGYDAGTQIGYSCDSRGGSSGAPLVDSVRGQVIGLHHLGGCLNAATHMTSICADAGALLACSGDPGTPGPTVAPTATPSPTATPTPTPQPTARPALYVEVTPRASGVTASSHDGNAPGNTVDDRLATRWSAYGRGQSIRYDLGTTRIVGYVSLAVYRGNERRNRFHVQVSKDGCTWKTVFSGASSGRTTGEEIVDFPDEPARYVRYVGLGALLNAGGSTAWNSVTEISLFAAP